MNMNIILEYGPVESVSIKQMMLSSDRRRTRGYCFVHYDSNLNVDSSSINSADDFTNANANANANSNANANVEVVSCGKGSGNNDDVDIKAALSYAVAMSKFITRSFYM